MDFPSTTLRFFFNNDYDIAAYTLTSEDVRYPISVPSTSQLDDVEILILNASFNSNNRFLANFLSSMTVNISALRVAGITSVGCGDFGGKSNYTILPAPSNAGIKNAA